MTFTLKNFTQSGGYSWTAPLPNDFKVLSDINKSKFYLCENGIKVSKNANAMHEDIKNIGGGLHAYWSDGFICLSTTDNKDPNLAEKKITLEKIEIPLILPFGGCTIFDPVYALESHGLAVNMQKKFSNSNNSIYTHTLGEHLQVVDCMRRVREIPGMLNRFCNIPIDFCPDKFSELCDGVDILFVEACANIEIVFRETILNYNRLDDFVVSPANEALKNGNVDGKEWCLNAQKWFYDGLLKLNPERAKFANNLIKYMPSRSEEDEFLRTLVLESYPRRIDISTIFHQIDVLTDIFKKPFLLFTYTQKYMPDGRSISWPPSFHSELLAEAKRRSIKIVHPPELVQEYGVEIALKSDMQHYKESFLKIIGERYLQYI
jgi:hypothetical protein